MPEIITEIIYAISDILHELNVKFFNIEIMEFTMQKIFEVLIESDKRKKENENLKLTSDD
jgi:hypothetical protein